MHIWIWKQKRRCSIWGLVRETYLLVPQEIFAVTAASLLLDCSAGVLEVQHTEAHHELLRISVLSSAILA